MLQYAPEEVRAQPMVVLRKASVSDFVETEDPLQDAERVFLLVKYF